MRWEHIQGDQTLSEQSNFHVLEGKIEKISKIRVFFQSDAQFILNHDKESIIS